MEPAIDTTEQSDPTSQDQNVPNYEDGPSRDELAKFFEGDDKGEGDDKPVTKPKPPTGSSANAKPESADKSEPDEEDEAGMPKLAVLLKAHEKAQKIREAATAEADDVRKLREEFEASKSDYDRRVHEAEARAAEAEKRHLEEREQLFSTLRTDPLGFIKKAGWDPSDLVHSVARAGTPEWEAEQKLRSELGDTRQKLSTFEKFVEDQKKREAEFIDYQRKQQIESVYKDFLTNHMNDEKAPNARLVASLASDPDAYLRAEGDRVYMAIQAQTGKSPGLDEVAEYIEWQAAKRLEAKGLAKVRGEQAKPATENGKALRGTSSNNTASRTLSASVASERRASPKPIHQMTRDEERRALEEAFMEGAKTAT
jgi:hypothetical protein